MKPKNKGKNKNKTPNPKHSSTRSEDGEDAGECVFHIQAREISLLTCDG
jgi:hypothetical protein